MIWLFHVQTRAMIDEHMSETIGARKHCFRSEHNKIKLAQWMQQGYVAPCIKEKQPRTDHMYEMQSRFLLQMRVLHGHLAANRTHRTA